MELTNKKILIFVADGYEDLELHYPKLRMIEAGAQVVVAAAEKKEVFQGKHGYPCKEHVLLKDVKVADFDALIIPGGHAPDKLRTFPDVLKAVQSFHNNNKLIAFICHAGWVPISAGVLRGIKCTSYHAIKDDLINAGANWMDESVVVDRNFISSRCPADLPAFCAAIIQHLKT